SSRTLQISFGAGMPSRDFTSEDLFSSPMMSMHSSTHSSQMNTVEPAMSLRTSCWLLPQNVQWSVFLESLPPALFISVPRLDASRRGRYPYAPDGIAVPSGASAISHDRRGYAFGHVICADADALQARPPFNGW